MDQKRSLTTTIGVAVLLAIFFIFIAQSIVNADKVCRLEDIKVVRIVGQSEGDGALTVEPNALDITSGDCVVWVNWSKGVKLWWFSVMVSHVMMSPDKPLQDSAWRHKRTAMSQTSSRMAEHPA